MYICCEHFERAGCGSGPGDEFMTVLFKVQYRQTQSTPCGCNLRLAVKIQTEFYLGVALAIVHLIGRHSLENSKQIPQKFTVSLLTTRIFSLHTKDETKVICLSNFVDCKSVFWSSCMHVSSLLRTSNGGR